MMLFLLALGVLFAASLVGYVAIRLYGPNHPPAHALHLPALLWISTLLIIASSFTMSAALRAVRSEKQALLRSNLIYSLGLTIAFVGVQTPAMIQLLRIHLQMPESGIRMYGMLFVLILLHAAHVIGGVVALAIVVRGSYQGRYDHEHFTAVQNAVWYWHFLDVIWIVMFTLMLSIG
jgi:heme/copper-type cytochrome/quinol oxidase subunit 3